MAPEEVGLDKSSPYINVKLFNSFVLVSQQGKQWYDLYTHSRHEKAVAHYLEKHQIEALKIKAIKRSR